MGGSPLRGVRVVVTRARAQAGGLSERIRELGAEVLEMPLIEVVLEADRKEGAEVLAGIGAYEWVVFTSANGVRGFFRVFFETFDDIRSLGMLRIAAIGKGTAEAVQQLHLRVDLIPPQSVGESLAESLAAEQTLDNLRILVVTGNRNREVLVSSLEEQRAIVDQFQVYRTDLRDLATDPVAGDFRERGADAIVFTSSSTVHSFAAQSKHLQLGPEARRPLACSFGPMTSQAMRAAGVPVDLESPAANLEAMVQALVTRLRRP